jgi:SOS-response transcriptional repressor LexA
MNGLPTDADPPSEVGDVTRVLADELSKLHTEVMEPNWRHVKRKVSPYRCVGRLRTFRYRQDMSKLADLLEAKGVSGNKLAAMIGTSRQTVSKLVNGKLGLSPEWAVKIGTALGVPPQSLLFDDTLSPTVAIREAPVRGEVAAGRWFEHDDMDQGRFAPVPCVPGPYGDCEQFAFRVAGTSMDKARIQDGDFVVCVPYWQVRASMLQGDLVVVEQRDGQRIERTVKELVVTRDGYELWPRSSDPKWQEPIRVPRKKDAHTDGGLEIEIVGLVIGRYAPMTR